MTTSTKIGLGFLSIAALALLVSVFKKKKTLNSATNPTGSSTDPIVKVAIQAGTIPSPPTRVDGSVITDISWNGSGWYPNAAPAQHAISTNTGVQDGSGIPNNQKKPAPAYTPVYGTEVL